MRILADCGISPQTVRFLQERGHDVTHARALGMSRASDREIVAHAVTDGRIVLTFDLDFGEILALGVLDKPSVLICRLADERPESINRRLSIVLEQRATILEAGYSARRTIIGSTLVARHTGTAHPLHLGMTWTDTE